ncbi:hypothetical protein [Streptomyces sp. NPDC059943]|uniref:hypothetical protein n=1 Tax=Streptomyces sp. NPDC059943 TaxID=3347010 RepID=UPI0036497876
MRPHGSGPLPPPLKRIDLARELLKLLLRETPSAAGSDALQVLALARVTTEDPVRRTLDVPVAEAQTLFAWLHGLSFVRSTAAGLISHGLVREAVLVDLRWRDPETNERLLRRLHAHLTERLTRCTGELGVRRRPRLPR